MTISDIQDPEPIAEPFPEADTSSIAVQEATNKFYGMWAASFDGSRDRPPYSVYQMINSRYHQMGKTFFAMRQAEKVTEVVKGRKFNPDNISFEIKHLLDRREIIGKYEFQILDEPQSVASNRSWHEEAQNLLCEQLMYTNRDVKPFLMPCPMSAMVDNRVYDISTSLVTIEAKGRAKVYSIQRDLLNRRSGHSRTPCLMYMTFEKPSVELQNEYRKRFEAWRESRRKYATDRLASLEKEGSRVYPILEREDLVPLIIEEHNKDPSKLVGRNGKISPSKVQVKWKIPYNRAQEAAAAATEALATDKIMENIENQA